MKAARKQLKMALETHLLPLFARAGFFGPSILRGHSLCYHFHRPRGGGYEFLTVQFEKYGGPQFRVNFSEVTREELDQRREFFASRLGRLATAEETPAEPWGSLRGHLHPSRLPYFKLFTWFDATRTDPSRVTLNAAALYPENEAWWRERKVGAHLWIPDVFFSKKRKNTLAALMRQRA
jgi:hypothetical protein